MNDLIESVNLLINHIDALVDGKLELKDRKYFYEYTKTVRKLLKLGYKGLKDYLISENKDKFSNYKNIEDLNKLDDFFMLIKDEDLRSYELDVEIKKTFTEPVRKEFKFTFKDNNYLHYSIILKDKARLDEAFDIAKEIVRNKVRIII